MSRDDEWVLARYGWEVECEHPLEIRHEDGSFATLNAARIVIDECRKTYRRFERQLAKMKD